MENSLKFFSLTAQGHKKTEINTRWHGCTNVMEPCVKKCMVVTNKSICLWRGVGAARIPATTGTGLSLGVWAQTPW